MDSAPTNTKVNNHNPDRADTNHNPDRADTNHNPDRADTNHNPDRADTNHNPDRADTNHNPDRADTNNNHPSPERIAIVRWAAGLGAVTAEAMAEHLGVGVASARARLLAAERERLLKRCSLLTGRPALYTVTRAGLRKADAHGLDPCRVSASNALHLIECAHAAAALERCYPDHRVQGERELRSEELELGRALASAELGVRTRGAPSRHRPDLVLWPRDPAVGLPVAVEVELTVKGPERLAAICRAWARARCVAGVLYLAAPDVERAVQRAIERAHAHERVVVVPLGALPEWPVRPAERTVPSSA